MKRKQLPNSDSETIGAAQKFGILWPSALAGNPHQQTGKKNKEEYNNNLESSQKQLTVELPSGCNKLGNDLKG